MRRPGTGSARRGGFRGIGGGGAAAYNPLTSLGTLGAYWDFALGVTEISGGVDSILDQSGRGNTLSAPAATNRPAYTVSDVDFNGQPTGTGDGTNDSLRRATISMGSAFAPGAIILVVKAVTATAGDAYFSMGVNSSLIRENNTSPRLQTLQGTGSILTTTTFIARAHVVAYVANGSTIQQYVDGVPEGTSIAYTGTTADGSSVALFSRSDAATIVPANCKIAFAAISLSSLTAAQMLDFGAYARSRWGTP